MDNNGWIPVTERLPNGEVWWVATGGGRERDFETGRERVYKWVSRGYPTPAPVPPDATHWLQIPEPPEPASPSEENK